MPGTSVCTFLELFGSVIYRALAFGIEHQAIALFQSESAGAHGSHQIRIRINGHQPEGAPQKAEKPFAEDLAGADIKHVFKEAPWNLAGDNRTVEKTLVIRREDEGAFLWKLLFAAHA